MTRAARQAERDQFFRWADKNKALIEEEYKDKNLKYVLERYIQETGNVIILSTLKKRIVYVIDTKLINEYKKNKFEPTYGKECNLKKQKIVERICPKCHKKYKTKLGRDGLPLHNRCLACKTAELRYRTVK